MYRRNFTFGLASPMSDSDGAAWVPGTGPAESWTLTDEQFPVGTDGQDVNSIACAVNTFGQNDIYGYVYNGLCFRGGYTPSGFGKVVAVPFRVHGLMTHLIGFPAPPSFSQCNIEFATTGNTKRSIGQFHGWHVNRTIHLRFQFFENGVADTTIGITMLDEVNITVSTG